MTEINGFEVRSADGRSIALAMQRLWLTGQILPVGARLMVQHNFCNDEDTPLEVVYAFMLPRDAAPRKFEIRGDGFEAHSELRSVEDAQRVYEEGIEAGSLSTLARSYRDGVVNLSLGNLKKGDNVIVTLEILAGVELRDNGLRFRFPFALAPGYHGKARMIDNDGEGEIELPQAGFGDVILPTYRRSEKDLHEVGFDLALRIPGNITEIGSPSHAVRVRDEHGARRVTMAKASDSPNRDVVIDVRVAEPETVVLGDERHFAISVPSTKFGHVDASPRKVALVIDRSGSMGGAPMAQAKRAVEACLGALSQDDEFALVAFDNEVECFRETLTKASMANREAAKAFLKTVAARGGTELAAGFEKGARLVRGGGEVLVLTDGQVMGTEDILALARKLGVRIHCLGIGSASQDRFLSQLASETGGVSRFVTPQERVDVAAVDLFASIGRPVTADVTASGADFAIEPQRYVFGGSPWVAFGDRAARTVRIAWKGGGFELAVPEETSDVSDTVRLLSGSRQISDLESRMTEEMDSELKGRLAKLSASYGLSSRAMSLVAVVKRSSDVAGATPMTTVVPVGMPEDTQFEAYFGNTIMRGLAACPAQTIPYSPSPPLAPGAAGMQGHAMSMPSAISGIIGELRDSLAGLARPRSKKTVSRISPSSPAMAQIREDTWPSYEPDPNTDRLLEIASMLQPDGGAPGSSPDDRTLKTIAAILFFLSEGHTSSTGAFRAHVERMVRFLETVQGLKDDHREIVDNMVTFARAGKKPTHSEVQTWADAAKAIS